jgi:hypothetical protein
LTSRNRLARNLILQIAAARTTSSPAVAAFDAKRAGLPDKTADKASDREQRGRLQREIDATGSPDLGRGAALKEPRQIEVYDPATGLLVDSYVGHGPTTPAGRAFEQRMLELSHSDDPARWADLTSKGGPPALPGWQ